MDWISNIQHLGSGIGFRKELEMEIIYEHENYDFIEIIGDNYIKPTQRERDTLESLARDFKIIPHFIRLNIGSEDPLDIDYLHQINEVISICNPPYWSEHLSYNSVHGMEIGHLTKFPYTERSLEYCLEKIQKIQSHISIPLILENISYLLNHKNQEYTEVEFINQLINNSNVGLLLDITNVLANSQNHLFDAEQYILSLPLDSVIQLHYVGLEYRDGIIIDSHKNPTSDEIWELFKFATERCTNLKGVILERDQDFSDPLQIREEVNKARDLWK